MNVLSLFDGMSCGRIALDKAGIDVTSYTASEIDKHAVAVSDANWSDVKQIGDVTKWRDWYWDIDWSSIDLLIGGSPCQGFSFAGKQLAFNDPRSALFFEFVNIRNHINKARSMAGLGEVKFLLENVKMKKQHLDVISGLLGVEPMFINSSLVSAQNRQRFYWFNWDASLPDDLGIRLNDILDDGYHSTRPKSYCLDANYGKGTNFRRYFYCGSRQLVLEPGYMPSPMTKETANDVMRSDGARWRKLSVAECERLQTVPAGYVDNVSIPEVEKYKVLGNGWTVDVITHLLNELQK